MKKISPLRAIKEKCFECSGAIRGESKRCLDTDCSLWPFRLGKKPKKFEHVNPEAIPCVH